jgi:S-layer protein
MAISTNGTVLARVAGALYNTQMSNATYKEVAALDPSSLTDVLYARDFAASTDLAVATTLVTNLGLTSVAGLANWVAAQLTAAGSHKGAKVVELLNGFAQMTADATYGAAATAFNTTVDAALALSQTTDNKGGTFAAAGIVTVPNATFTLTSGIDSFTGVAGNDTFAASTTAGALTLSALDAINGGAGTDTLSASVVGAIDTTSLAGLAVSNIENVQFTSTGAVTSNTTTWTGTTSVAVGAAGNVALTAAATTDVTVSTVDLTAAAGTELSVVGGKNVTSTSADTVTLGAAVASSDVVIGSSTSPATGAVTVAHTETVADNATAGASTGTTSTVTVNGGTSVVVSSNVTAGVGENAGDIVTVGAIGVNGKTGTTSVTVNQSAATATWAAAGDKVKVVNAAVTIADGNAVTASDTITTVTLQNFGNSTVASNVLSNLNLKGGTTLASGTVGLNTTTTDTSVIATTLNLGLQGGLVGAISGSQAAKYTTVNIASTADSTVADVSFTAATTLNVSGAGKTTISALTDIGAVTAIASTGAGLTLGAAIGNAVTFTGADGAESIIVGATTKAITTGAGNDTVNVNATALGTGGTIDAGAGTDTLSMTAANAVTASASNTFSTKLSNFEKFAVGDVAATGTVNMNFLNAINDVTVAGVQAGQVLTVAGLTSGANVTFTNATQTATTASLLNDGAADVLNVALSASNAATTVGTLVTTGFETVNFSTANSATTPTAQAHVITTLTDANAKSITVTGNAGLTLGTFSGTALTSFDASGVTLGGVSYTTGVLAAGATLTGGAGDDTLNAAASTATAGVTINAGSGADTITGSATKASVLNGGAGNDTITGGAAADSIDGGTGTNTYVFSSANVAEQAGSSTTTGVVINLGDTALTQSGVFTATGAYLTTVAPTVAAGTSTYLYSTESSTNASVIDTLTNINNVTGSNLADYIVGSATANVINAGAGADVLTGGSGSDTFVFAGSASHVATTDINNVVTDFAAGANGDKITLTTNTAFAHGGAALTVFASGARGDVGATVGLQVFSNNITVADSAVGPTLAEIETYLGTNKIFGTSGADSAVYLVVDNGTDSWVLELQSAGANQLFTAAEDGSVIVAKLTGIADATTLTVANFTNFA